MINFGKILYSNKAVLKFKNVSFIVIIVAFLFNGLLLATPPLIARASIRADEILDALDGLEGAFNEIYDLGLDCDITDYEICDLPSSANGYEIVIGGEPETDKFIWFAEELAISNDFSISGKYEFLEGFRLNPTEYRENTEAILYGMSASTIDRDYSIMYMGQVIQNLLFVLAISAMFVVANYRQPEKKITYRQALKISILAMLGPALFVSVIGLFFVQFANVIFMVIYSLRMMNLYFTVLKS